MTSVISLDIQVNLMTSHDPGRSPPKLLLFRGDEPSTIDIVHSISGKGPHRLSSFESVSKHCNNVQDTSTMVTLRSGKHVDLGHDKKAMAPPKDCPQRQSHPLSNGPRQAGREMMLDFDIYEDDPNIMRNDLDDLPLDCWETTAIDQENMEPCAAVRIASQRTARASGWPGTLSVNNLPVIAESSTSWSRPAPPARFALRQILQDDGDRERSSTCPEAQPSKDQKQSRSSGVTKSKSSKASSKQPRHGDVRNTSISKAGIERVNIMNLR